LRLPGCLQGPQPRCSSTWGQLILQQRVREDKNVDRILLSYGNHKIRCGRDTEENGGDVFEIETVRTYPSEYSALTAEAKRELQEGDLPALKKIRPTCHRTI